MILWTSIGLAVAVGALGVWRRDATPLVALVFAGLLANADLPVEGLGARLTSQRLAAAAGLGFLALALLRRTFRWPPVGIALVAIHLTYGYFVVGALVRADGRPGLVGAAAAQLVLLDLVVLLLAQLDQDRKRRSIDVWLPAFGGLVLLAFLVHHVAELGALDEQRLQHFRQSFRLRRGGERDIVNVWSATLVIFLAFLVPQLRKRAEGLPRRLGLVAGGVAIASVVLTFSRAGLFGLLFLAFALAVFALLGGRRSEVWRLIREGLAVAASAALVLALVQASGIPVARWTWERLAPVVAGQDTSLQRRLDLARLAHTQVRERAQDPDPAAAPREERAEGTPKKRAEPAKRHDAAQETAAPAREARIVEAPENTYLFVSLTHGLPGLAVYLAMLAVLGSVVLRRWWRERSRPGESAVWPALFFTYVTLLATNDFLYFSPGTFLLAILVAWTAGGWSPPETRAVPRAGERRARRFHLRPRASARER